MYLYVDKAEGTARVPEALLELFGKPVPALLLLLDEQKPLARADARKVLVAIAEQGFYLQMPQVEDDYMQAINQHNSKLAQQ